MNATPTAARPSTRPADRPAPHVRIPVNLDVSRIKPSHLKMLLILEAFWGDKSYCWPSNETLAKKFGCSVSRARQILYEMEDRGYIYLLPADPAKPHGERAGIFAHRRLNPDRPVEDRPPPPEAIDRLWATRAKSLGAGVPLVGIPTTPPVGIPTTPLVGIPTPSKEYSLSLNQTHSEPPDASLDQRQRKDHPEPEPLPAVPAQETPAAVHPLTEPLPAVPAQETPAAVHPLTESLPAVPAQETPTAVHPLIEPAPIPAADGPGMPVEPSPAPAAGNDQAGAVEPPADPREAFLAGLNESQRRTFDKFPPDRQAKILATDVREAFLEALTPEQRSAFDALPAARQAEILAPHALGLDRVMVADQAAKLSPRQPVELPPIPLTTEELIEQLPGAPREWAQQAAQGFAIAFGGKKDAQLWGEFHKIAELVRRGQIEAGDVLNAHRQAMAPGIERPGAKFWAAFKGLTGLDEGDLKDLIAGKEPRHVP